MVEKEISQLDKIRHSLAHVLAMAVLEKFPEAKLGIGPVIENGFYYDFQLPEAISDADLPALEDTMRRIIKSGIPFSGKEVTLAEAEKMFADQPFKLDLIKEFSAESKTLTAYTSGTFTDLCRGGHVDTTREIHPNGIKLVKVAGAYWRGSEKNPQLTRIYGLAFETKDELQKHLKALEEAAKRDHRKLGKELKLFALIDEIGPGLPLFYPAGAVLRRLIEGYITELQESRGYEPIWIPHITKGDLYKISGHLDKYDAMYPPMELADEASYYLKPMNCPHFMMLYKTQPHSYRELPVRWVSTTTNYRYEKSGELSGLTRVRSLTQDDCHVFARPDQIEGEINLMLDMLAELYRVFGFNDFWVRISTHDPKDRAKYIGSHEVWKESEAALERLIQKRGWKHEIVPGEAAFYGPKLDFMFKDVIGRQWQLSTVQLDMNLPERFDLEYIDDAGKKQRPIVIHRALLGSTERFLGIIIEHFAGAFPLWLSPTQVKILPISEKLAEYAERVRATFVSAGIRAEIDTSNETLGKKIRAAEMAKSPYIAVLGAKEEEAGTASLRARGKGDLGAMPIADCIEKLREEIKNRA